MPGGAERRGASEGVVKVFIVSRRHDARVFLRIGRPMARVLAGRCVIVCCLGGCVRFVFGFLSPSLILFLSCLFISFPSSSLIYARFARFDVFRISAHTHSCRLRTYSRGRAHGRIIFASRHLDVNICRIFPIKKAVNVILNLDKIKSRKRRN